MGYPVDWKCTAMLLKYENMKKKWKVPVFSTSLAYNSETIEFREKLKGDKRFVMKFYVRCSRSEVLKFSNIVTKQQWIEKSIFRRL